MIRRLLVIGLVGMCPLVASAQQVILDLGGTGAYGPLNITADTTITLPPDGVIQATSVNIAAGATLSFARNASNTGVTIVSQGDVVINGTISVAGSPGVVGAGGVGGPGGGNGGKPTIATADDYGPQWYTNNIRNYSTPNTPAGHLGGYGSYPNVTTCTQAGAGGGGGGGALIIYSNSKITTTQAGAILNAGGGAAPATKPTDSTGAVCGIQATPGDDGLVRLIAPTIDASALTIVGGAFLQRLFDKGTPAVQSSRFQVGTPTVSQAMNAFVPNPLAVSIVSIDGTTLPAGSQSYNYMYPTTATTSTVVTKATGCNPGNLAVYLASNGFVRACTADISTFQNVASATSNWTCPLGTNSSSGQVFAFATCDRP